MSAKCRNRSSAGAIAAFYARLHSARDTFFSPNFRKERCANVGDPRLTAERPAYPPSLPPPHHAIRFEIIISPAAPAADGILSRENSRRRNQRYNGINKRRSNSRPTIDGVNGRTGKPMPRKARPIRARARGSENSTDKLQGEK